MSKLDLFTAVLCALSAIRLILFARAGSTHRPYASLLAYLLIVATGALALLILFGLVHGTSWPQLLINAVFTAALWAVRGNVVELFRHVDPYAADCRLLALLRKTTWF